MRIQDVIAVMEAHHAPMDPTRPTCDGIIVGDGEKECTGVVLTCCPTAEVIRKTADLGYNFIIAHEPTFFDGRDETDWLGDNSVYQAKRELIDKTGVTIYRNHDHLHGDQPDGIFAGVMRLLGWEPYLATQELMPGCFFNLPPTTVGQIAQDFCRVAHIDGLRMVGDPEMRVERAGFLFHFGGGPMDRIGIDFIEKHDVQVIIPGETADWTIVEYVQDAVELGKKRALLTPGHFNWEEPGMEYMAGWLGEALKGKVPVTFVQSGNQYRWEKCEGYANDVSR